MNVPVTLSAASDASAILGDSRRSLHQYPTRHGASGHQYDLHNSVGNGDKMRVQASHGDLQPASSSSSSFAQISPAKKDLKHVVFQLIDPEDPRYQARLPMRVMISPHDGTESIISTVKNFYGLYECGVSFEDKEGITIIAHHDNFYNNMTVYVRMVAQSSLPPTEPLGENSSPKRPTLGPAIEMRGPSFNAAHSEARATGRSVGGRSTSPPSDFDRRHDASSNGAVRARSLKIKTKSVAGDTDGYSSGDNDQESVTSSRRSKLEEIKADITVDNIVEGGRRKRAFESSELPLFVPPQVPISASISSISPQRRSGPHLGASPHHAPVNQQTFSYTQPLPSPQSYGVGYPYNGPRLPSQPYQNNYQQGNRPARGSRTSGASYGSHRASNGILPTPDPTVGSVISDEDVALQLMRLGDPTAFSHGRTSTSTADDALSGKADAASSDEDDEEDEEEDDGRGPQYSREDHGPQRKKQRVMNELRSDGTSGEEYEDRRDGNFDAERKASKPKLKKAMGASNGKPRALSMSKVKKTSLGVKTPMSPASLPAQSRKPSISSTINFQHQLGEDEEDLSSKPRCQRCRKSKKGCDRQRPCGRCKDAGIGIEGCISEDEGNGRKGRYGRHMGVTVKKAEESVNGDASPVSASIPAIAAAPSLHPALAPTGVFLAPALPDKANNKKRKR